jgi:cytochrome c biogenesis protein CcdA/thiol-disulfide isomerase/thioredoxin
MKRGSVALAWLFAAMLTGLFLPLTGVPTVDSQEAVVRFHFFYSEDCDDCQQVKDELLPALDAQYGDQIEINYLEISDMDVFEQMVSMEEQYAVPEDEADIPEVYIGDHALIGTDQIRTELPRLIDEYLAQGGVELHSLDASATSEGDKPVVRFLLFYGETCPHCHSVMDNFLPGVYEKYGDQVEYRYIEVWSDTENYITFLGLETKLGVPEEDQGSVPVVVIGDKVLRGSAQIPAELEGYIDEYLAQGGVDYPSLDDLPEVVLPTPEPAVQVLVFLDPSHKDFEELKAFVVSLGQEYGNQFQAGGIDVSQAEGAAMLAEINEAWGVEPSAPGTPQVAVGGEMLVGLKEIERELPGLIEKLLAEGGYTLTSWEDLVGAGPAATPALQTATPTSQSTIHLLYFYKTGCQDCDRAKYDLNYIQETYPQVQVVEYNIEQNQALAEWLGESLGVAEEERLESPAIVIGTDHLIHERMTLRNIQAAVEKYLETGAEPVWEEFSQDEQEEARESLIERYRSLGALTVLGAGLVNGLNPCAFVTIVFFLSYLAFIGRRGREILLVGAAFTLGVFVTYLVAGLGLNQLMEPLAGVQATLKRWVFGFTAVLCLALAGISLYDYVKARQGKTDEMKLKLSLDLRRRVNRVIREGSKMRAFYLVAFAVGAIVSLIQLTCTSPIYIGIVFLINDVPEMQANAILYLVLYNLAYIVPLVVIFVLAFFGTSSEQLGGFITQRTATIKLLTVVVFLVLAGWLVYSLLPLFGVT